MKKEKSFIQAHHNRTKRSYSSRIDPVAKLEAMEKAQLFDYDYWDGDRKYGFGGYYYDGRWETVAKEIVANYGITADDTVLEVGCGKGYLLYEIKKILPGIKLRGLEISTYAKNNAHEEIKDIIDIGNATELPYQENEFDYILSSMTLHNLEIDGLFQSLKEIQRVKRKDSWISVESYRNNREKLNMLNWQLTCNAFYSKNEWSWIFDHNGYEGDYEFVYFE